VIRVTLEVRGGSVGGIRKNNIGNGGKHQNKKKEVEIKTQKQSYEVLVYKGTKLSLDPPTSSNIIILMLFLFVLILR
jgi:hypothetical protein